MGEGEERMGRSVDWEETNDVDWQHFTGEGLSVRVGCIRVASILSILY